MAQAAAAPYHGLTTIPLEVFERIAEHAEPQDLLPLRLASREIASRVYRTYVKAHFTERAFLLYSKDSLQTLLEIAESEDLAQYMTTLILCTDFLTAEDMDDMDMFVEPYISQMPVAEARFLRQSRIKRWKVLFEEQSTFDAEGLLAKLTLIFARFRQSGNAIGIKITTQYAEAFNADSHSAMYYKTIRAETGGPVWIRSDCERRSHEVIFEALNLSCLKIETFNNSESNVPLPSSVIASNKAFVDTYIVASTLRCLKLQVYCEKEDSVTELTRLYSMLSHLESLEELELDSYLEVDPALMRANKQLDPALFCLDLPLIKTFVLRQWSIKYADLLAFLRAQQELVAAACKNCYVMLNAEHHELTPSEGPGNAQEQLIELDASRNLWLQNCMFERVW